ncbi:MAG: HAD family phosphatase [Cytophagales bacterium]|nr:HAD family phosphatase [Cytophagales bacterium]
MNHKEIENIIFDLGGVIINLNIENTFRKFSELFKKDISVDIFSDHRKYGFFRAYEVGRISDEEFRGHIRELAGFPVEDRQIDDAWIAMLMEIPEDRISWIYEATRRYNCVVLSNTNSIHVKYFEAFFNKVTPYGYPKDVWQKLYYSHEIGERKPDAAAFEYVLNDSGFDPSKTVLFDDLKDNLESANKLGIRTEYVVRNQLRKEQLLDEIR